MKKTKFQKLFFILIFFLILILSLRKIIVLGSGLMIGHNWDWTFPNSVSMFHNLNFVSKYTWWSIDQGTVTNLNISHIFPDSFLAMMSYLWSPIQVVTLLIIFIITYSYFAFKKLLDYLISDVVVNYIPALLFAFSPFLFNEIIGGSWYMWIAFAFSPTYFLYHLKFQNQGGLKNFIYFIFASIFVVSSLQNFILLEAVCLLHSIITSKIDKTKIIRIFQIYGGLLILNFYWLYPFLLTLHKFGQIVTNSSFTGEFVAAKNSTQDVLSIFNLTAYLDRNIYLYSLPRLIKPFFYSGTFVLWTLIFYRLRIKKVQNNYIIWIGIYLLVMFFAKGGNIPFPNLTMWLYKINPFMGLYRSPQHLVFAAAFITPILLAYVFHDFQKSKIKYVLLTLVIIWISGWWINGDVGQQVLSDQGKDSINFYSLPPELASFYKMSEDSGSVHRIVFLPTVISPFFIDNDLNKIAEGGQAEYLYLENSTLTAENNEVARSIDEYYCSGRSLDFIKLLSYTNVRYVIVRKDILPQHTSCIHKWDHNLVERNINSEKRLSQIFSGSESAVYKLSDNLVTPRIYIPTSLSKIEAGYQSFLDQISKKSFIVGGATYASAENQSSSTIDNPLLKYIRDKNTKVDFTRINPTKYQVKLYNIKSPTPLIFLENYNSSWKIYSDNMNKPIQTIALDLIFARPLGEKVHFRTNYYANGWLINPEESCQQNFKCTKNGDGSYNIDFLIEFDPQRRFYVGTAITVFFITLGSVVFCLFKAKYHYRAHAE